MHTKLNLWTYICEDPEEAKADAERYYGSYSETALRHYELAGSHFGGIKGYETYATMAAELSTDPDAFARSFRESHPWGTPEEVLAQSIELAHRFGADELIFVFKYGNMPHEKAMRSMRLFAEKVLPELKKINPAPITPWIEQEAAE